ncbi:TetR/AcrR family transcriptional regulator [Arthrobacter sunyaminii]|nr:TetR/AcrR family transcriptional regulator [Arthrobacter sunyaminii]
MGSGSIGGEAERSAAAGMDWRNYSEQELPPVLAAALACFVEQGYHGTTIREVAGRAGLSVPGIYHHYSSKHALLEGIVQRAMTDLYQRSEAALAEAGPGVEERFRLLIECLVLFHAHRSEHAFIAASEIRSLQDDARAAHIAARDRQQLLLTGVVNDGVSAGVFATPYPAESARAVITMCTGVAQWYRSAGELSPEDLAARYVVITRAAMGS